MSFIAHFFYNFNMKKIGIFCDLDGTLMNSQKIISDFDKEMISKVRALGHKFYIVTGKSVLNSIEYYDELNLDTILVTSMGQVLSKPHDPNFKPIVHPVCFKDVDKLFKDVEAQFGIRNYLLETLDDQFIVQKDVESNLIKLITEGRNPKEYHGEKINNIIGCYAEINDTSHLNLLTKTQKLNEVWQGKFEFAFWMTDGNLPIIQMKPTHTGKSIAMKEIMELDNLDYSISFGNGWSDRHMLAEANEGYAMKNSATTVKAFTKFQTKFDNNESGVGLELKQIFKI